MQVYINGVLRDDVFPLVGGSLEQTAEHKTASKISIKLPSDECKNIKDCDYIQLVNNGVIVHAGTILGISQQDIGQRDLGFKIYDLTITSNADYVSSVLVDLVFPSGASIANVLFGNHDEGEYVQYCNKNLPKFSGILERRVAQEDITIGTVDDFSKFILSEQATLWGSYVDDVLDSLCKTAGAWWEITNDKVFNMRYDINREEAPLMLKSTKNIYELAVTSEAYTLYSAVRVIGGKGKGSKLITDVTQVDKDYKGDKGFKNSDAQRVSDTEIELKYPFHSEGYLYIGSDKKQIGIKGTDEENSKYDLLVSVGDTKIEANGEYKIPSSNKMSVEYYPLVPIVARLTEPKLVEQIKAQRGGTGVIECILKDEKITDFKTASTVGATFLQNGSGRAKTVSFKTQVPGCVVGQIFKNCNIPLYGVIGNYKITAITAEIIDDENIEYTISASTSAYNDSLKSLFYNAKSVNFKLGDDFPAIDGIYIIDEVEVKSAIEILLWKTPTCKEMKDMNRTCSEWKSLQYNWKQILNAVEVENLMGNYLTKTARNTIAELLLGTKDTVNLKITDCNLYGSKKDVPGISKIDTIVPTSDPEIDNDTIMSTYYIDPKDFTDSKFTELQFGDSENPVQSVKVDIDKRCDENEKGKFAVTITKKDVVI